MKSKLRKQVLKSFRRLARAIDAKSAFARSKAFFNLAHWAHAG
jgi:hypothetical protein